jgi:monoamine oxidase
VHNLESLADPGWYSHSLSLDKNNRLITTSGIIAQRKDGTFPPTLAEQIPTILSNVEAALHGAGATRRDIVQMRFYVVGWEMSTAGDVMGPLIKWLDGLKPATTLVPVTALAFPEAKIEIETIAAITGSARPWNSLDSHITNNTTTALSHAPPPIEIDVIVVGGGFSGMSAAYDLKKAGIKSIVLEARHRIGGRSWSTKLKSGPGYVDLGATWINNKTQPAVYALAQEFGLETYAQYLDGVDVYEGVDGKPVKVQDSMANPNTVSTMFR